MQGWKRFLWEYPSTQCLLAKNKIATKYCGEMKSKIRKYFLIILLFWKKPKKLCCWRFFFSFSDPFVDRSVCWLFYNVWSDHRYKQFMALQSYLETSNFKKRTASLAFTATLFRKNLVPGPEVASRHEMRYCLMVNLKPFTGGIQEKNDLWAARNHWLPTADICAPGDALRFLTYEAE